MVVLGREVEGRSGEVWCWCVCYDPYIHHEDGIYLLIRNYCSSSYSHSKCSFCTGDDVREKDDGRFWIQIKKMFEKILEREEERVREREREEIFIILSKRSC